MIPLALVAYALSERETRGEGVHVQLSGGGFVLWALVSLAYPFVGELATGTTPGKRLFGLAVVGVGDATPSPGQVMKRSLLRIVDAFPAFYLVGFVALLASPSKQRLGDLAAGTHVVRAPDAAPSRARGRTALLGLIFAVLLVIGIVAAVARASQDAPEDHLGPYDYDPDVVQMIDASLDALFVQHDAAAALALMPPDDVLERDMPAAVAKLEDYIGTYTGSYRVVGRERSQVQIPELGPTEILEVRLDAAFTSRRGLVLLVFGIVDDRLQLVQWHIN